MPSLTAYKGVNVVNGATGDAGIALTANFKTLADSAPNQSSSDPGPGNDINLGYQPGNQWFNTSTKVMWSCISNTLGAAVWKSIYQRTSTGLALIPAESSDSVTVAGSLSSTGSVSSATALIATKAATSGVQIYNTTDQVTNYERLSFYYAFNNAYIGTLYGGTGSGRTLMVGVGTSAGGSAPSGRYIQFAPNDSTGLIKFGLTSGSVTALMSLASVTSSASSGTPPVFAVNPTINQTSTAGYTALLVNPTETATGSGTRLLADFQLGGTSKLSISTAGIVTLADATNLSAGTSTGTKIGTGTTQKLGFWNVTPVVQQVLATGASHTVDDVITLLQTLGLCRQS